MEQQPKDSSEESPESNNNMAYAAKELFDCVNKAAESEYIQEQAVSETAALCAVMMGWTAQEE